MIALMILTTGYKMGIASKCVKEDNNFTPFKFNNSAANVTARI